MTVQTVKIIADRISSADFDNKLAVFALPLFIRGDGQSLIHNEFKYTRDHLLDFFDAFFDDTVVGNELVKRGHNGGGKLIGVYGKADVGKFNTDIRNYQRSL
jgi:hypothetical protein